MKKKRHRIPPEQLETARSFRREPTFPEKLLWSRLRGERCAKLKFRRQVVSGPYYLDFYCAAARLVVEIDGETHEKQREHDARRTAYLQQLGLQVIRYTNADVLDDVDAVAAGIAQAALKRIEKRIEAPPPQ